MTDDMFHPVVSRLNADGHGLDVVGDVHGCLDELLALSGRAGYRVSRTTDGTIEDVRHGDGRILVLVGDLTDRGPDSAGVLDFAMAGARSGAVRTVLGNHCWKLYRALIGRKVKVPASLEATLEEIRLREIRTPGFTRQVVDFLRTTPHQIRATLHPESHAGRISGDGSVTIVHAAAPEEIQDKVDRKSFERSLYGFPKEELDAEGHLVREDWAQAYRGSRFVIHGHTPMASARLINRTLCLDTGCVFGASLSLYRSDTGEILQEDAARNYSGTERLLAHIGAEERANSGA